MSKRIFVHGPIPGMTREEALDVMAQLEATDDHLRSICVRHPSHLQVFDTMSAQVREDARLAQIVAEAMAEIFAHKLRQVGDVHHADLCIEETARLAVWALRKEGAIR